MNPKYQQLIDNFQAAVASGEVGKFLPDNASIDEMERRIKQAGKSHKGVIYYSELVQGIGFKQSNLYGDEVHFIDIGGWTGLERKMVGTALAEIAVRNLPEADCLITCIVVLKDSFSPSPTFFEWISWSGLIEEMTDAQFDSFWIDEFRKALTYFKRKV